METQNASNSCKPAGVTIVAAAIEDWKVANTWTAYQLVAGESAFPGSLVLGVIL
jgi:hypothetical protein